MHRRSQEWDIEDEKFYNNEGRQIGTRNLWASIPNLLMGFAVWLMWSVTIAKIQKAHTTDPGVYYFKDFAPTIDGVAEGFRGCPGWSSRVLQYLEERPAGRLRRAEHHVVRQKRENADLFMYSQDFHKMAPVPAG